MENAMLALVLSGVLLCGCGGGGTSSTTPGPVAATPANAPTISTSPAQNGAVIVSLASTTPGATIYYTLDATTPTTSAQIYQAPFLVASSLTVSAMATAPSASNSTVTTKAFTPTIASGTLVWSDEFTSAAAGKGQPNAQVWTYDIGNNGFGNAELETYCAWNSSTAPCSTASPNAYVGTDDSLHIVAQQPTAGLATYTSARMKSQGLFSFQYGRVEARIKIPESPGMWPAFWLLGNNIATVNWPACGELDVMEHINGSDPTHDGYDWVEGSVHGTKLDGGIKFHPTGFSAATWHTYGMIWSKGQIQYYVDDPANVYATFAAATQAGTWPFDTGPQFLLLNLAVGGNWPGPPNATTVFPSEMVVDYVRIYSN